MTTNVVLSSIDSQRANEMSLGMRTVATLNGSPALIKNILPTRIMVLVSLGTVSLIEFCRDGVTFDAVGLIAGQFFLNSGDWLRITYIVAPTVVYYPF